MYNNDNRSRKSGTWVYMNGELYHAGIKGMKWGSHLPGTDWWKVGQTAYNRYMNKNTSTIGVNSQGGSATLTGRPSKIKALGYAGRAVATYAGNQARNTARRVGNRISTAAGNAYNAARSGAKRASAVAKAYTAYAKVTAKSLAKNIKNRASYGAYKAKKYVSKIANKSMSAIRDKVNSSRSKVSNFLQRIGLSGKRTSDTNRENHPNVSPSKNILGSRKKVSKVEKAASRKVPADLTRISGSNSANKSREREVKKKLYSGNSKKSSSNVNRVITISSQKSPYYKG